MYSPQTRPSGYRGGMAQAAPGLGIGSTRRHGDSGAAAGARGGRSGGRGQPRGDAARPTEPPRQGATSATELDRSARAAYDEMRELLKSQPPWSREVEQHRQKTRNYHQTLLFNHPIHPLAQSLDPIWVRTSYALIVSFRDHIARAEAAFAQAQGAQAGKRAPRNSPADQDLRKVLTRFRQALASEEGFYRQLAVRLVRFFELEDACKAALASTGLTIVPAVDGTEQGGPGGARLSKDEKKEKVALVYKAMICLGDVERYKEQYSDGYRREKVSGGARTGHGQAKAGETEERFGRARAYYDAARSLVAEDGSAFNQLAVISTYLNDDFATIYYYIRALAVRVPFKGIADILDKYLKKVFDRWADDTTPRSDQQTVEKWKMDLGGLIAALYRQNQSDHLRDLKSTVLPAMSQLVLARRLPSESIVRLTAISIGLQWNARNLAAVLPAGAQTQPHRSSAAASTAKSQQAEEGSLDFLLCVFIVLLSISAAEVEEVLNSPGWVNPADSAIADDDDGDARGLHTSISAVLRRILPSLRLISKWIKLHLDYISAFPLNDPATSGVPEAAQNPLATSIPTFWSAYYRLIEALARTFPLGMLPSLEHGLEEDEDMRGFLPISRGLLAPRRSLTGDAEMEVHPNEEQLMRIADLQTSGSQSITEPVSFADYETEVKTVEDDHASVSTETEDDPVNMAMRASLARTETPVYDDATSRPPPSHSTSAFDLLNNLVLDRPSTASYSRPPPLRTGLPSPRTGQPTPPVTNAAAGSPGLLFGGGGEGIWSMTREESSSQKGAKRTAVAGSPSLVGPDEHNGLSRPVSEQAKARIGGQGVKAIWDAPLTSASQGVAAPPTLYGTPYGFSSPLGVGGAVGAPANSGPADRRISGGAAPSFGFVPTHTAGIAAGQPPMDAAQLFAGISGLGLGSNTAQGWTTAAGNHGAIGRPNHPYTPQPHGQVPPPAQAFGNQYAPAGAQHWSAPAGHGGYGGGSGTWG